MLGCQIISSWMPFKWGASYGYDFDRRWLLDVEYSQSRLGLGALGLDVASVTERRYSILARRFLGNSFHLIIGAFRNEFEARVGNEILDNMANQIVDELKVSAMGLRWVSVTAGNGEVV